MRSFVMPRFVMFRTKSALAPMLGAILALSGAPSRAETTTDPAASLPAADISSTMRVTTLAEEILSAATIDNGLQTETETPATASPALPPEVALAIATAGVTKAVATADALTRETIEVRVSISQQMMEVWYKGEMIHEWPVSTARQGKVTPKGSYKPQWLSKNHKSSLYNNAPMPYSIFYSGNYAIHGTDQESKLGRPASAGCVRLSRANAAILFAMVQEEGKDRMKVQILD